ncbi:NADH:flavin oxidoreductase/NADH oxidase family protein [Amycolatopsis keratiniphila]|uniref:2,4-dienoyl-CoA reductase n=1 Tax=Amycolatopsis keratiniphila subsp. keratiniphila TaxID=227715 RepID=A0A1W2LYZ2_9PSEU|nr:NADH:flavin oxidoreductase/NADH oxidase family protein [Amycolatopsis keratiniphila]ONF72446.1 2,4-dienoyl-CoA reductase [Amycolatopsis keratiniphila subsp. keratiniphila]
MSSAVEKTSSPVFEPFTLPGGSTLPNRLVKAAMEENMASRGQLPGKPLFELYRRWGEGGAGLLITGNVMVHAEALTGPAGVVLDADSPLEPFRRWASAAKSGGARVWMQINHPGRQVRADMPGVAWGPSAVRVDVGKNSKRFAEPVEMSPRQIEETVARFAETARRAEEAGFDGVEIHAAHGYLLSQFLSPLANRREDRWGGGLGNRAAFLLDVVRAVRAVVAPGFAVAVKLNSADFQRGGFDADDAASVIAMLAPLGVDLVELSGGSYESPAMTGQSGDDRTRAREAYFLSLAEQLVRTSSLPLMLTGGVVRRRVAEEVLASGVELVGMGTALAVDPALPAKWRHDGDAAVELAPVRIGDKAVASAASMARVRRQLRRLGAGRRTKPGIDPKAALVVETVLQALALRRYRAWLHGRVG